MKPARKEGPAFSKIVFGLFLLLVASLAVQWPAVFYLEGFPVAVTDLLFPVVAVLAAVSFILRTDKLRWTWAYILFAVYLAAFIFASVFAHDLSRSVTKSLATAYLVGLAILSLNLICDEGRMRMTIAAWLIGSTIPVAVGLLALILFYIAPDNSILPHITYHYGAVPVGPYPRLSSTFISASMFCNYLNIVVMLLLIERTIGWLNERLWWVSFVASCVCLIFTISSGMGAVVLAIGMWVYYRQRSRIGIVTLVAGLVICTLFLLSSFIALAPHSTAPYSFELPVINIVVYPSPRLLVWTEAFQTFAGNFFVGKGPGSASAAVVFANTEGGHSLLTDAHNTFLSVAAQTGFMGLLSIIGICVYLLRIGFTDRSNPIVFGLATAFLTGFVVQGLTGSFEDARHLWVLIGMLVAANLNERTRLDHYLRSSSQ